MFDTVIFNRIRDGQLPIESIRGRRVFVTPVQREELRATPVTKKPEALLATLQLVNPEYVPATLTFDITGAGFDEGVFGDGGFDFDGMLASLRRRDEKLSKVKGQLNQVRDILIAESALRITAILVSDDRNLRDVMVEFGGSAMSSTGFWKSEVPAL